MVVIIVAGVLYFFHGVDRDYVFDDKIDTYSIYDQYYIDKYIYRYYTSWFYFKPKSKPGELLRHTCWFDAFTLADNLPFSNNKEALSVLNSNEKFDLERPVKNGADVIIRADEQSMETLWFPRKRLTDELFNPFAMTQEQTERYYGSAFEKDDNGQPECEIHLTDEFQKREPKITKQRQKYVFQLRNTHQEKLKELVKIISDPDTLVKLRLNCHNNTHILFYSLRKKTLLAYRSHIPFLLDSPGYCYR